MPDVINLPPEQARAALEFLGLRPVIQGQGPVVIDQTPKGLARVEANSKVILRLGHPEQKSPEVTVPDLTGYRIFEAARVLEAFGLVIKPEGNGIALEQEPVPGSLVLPGTSVQVKFGEEESKPVLGP
ncbi:MAG: PASTA domain-containing protein [Bacillota bacterium]